MTSPVVMKHWHGNQLCVVDTETTGLDENLHDIWEICLIPLDANGNRRAGILPFNITMRPENPELIDWSNPAITLPQRTLLRQALTTGIRQEKGVDLLLYWIKNKLKLPEGKRIIPLGHNYKQFDRSFIRHWLGYDLYDELFHFHSRDTMELGLYLNDRCSYHAQNPPFDRVDLKSMCRRMNIIHQAKFQHSAIGDCLATAALWRQLVGSGLFGKSMPEPSPTPIKEFPDESDKTA